MGFLTPKVPKTNIPAAPPQAAPPTLANSQVAASAGNARQRAAAAGLASGTTSTSSRGLQGQADTAQATLLG